jgi:hypothetical protein
VTSPAADRRKPRHSPAGQPGQPHTLEEVIASYRQEETALREIVREAHAAIKDLRALLREAKTFGDDSTRAWLAERDKIVALVTQEAHEAADAEMNEHREAIQAEMNRQAAILNEVIDRARIAVVDAIVPLAAELSDEGLIITWAGNKFDEDPLRDRTGDGPARNTRRTQIVPLRDKTQTWDIPEGREPTREDILAHPMARRLVEELGIPPEEVVRVAREGWQSAATGIDLEPTQRRRKNGTGQ